MKPLAAPAVLAVLLLAGCTQPPEAAPPAIGGDPAPAKPLLSLEDCDVTMVSQYLPASRVAAALPEGYTLTQGPTHVEVATRMATCARGSTEDRTLAAVSVLVTMVAVQAPAGAADPDAEHRYALDLAVSPPALADWFAAQGVRVRPGSVQRTAGPPEAFEHGSDAAGYRATLAPAPGPVEVAGPQHCILHLPRDGAAGAVPLDVRLADDGQPAAALLEVERGPLADLGSLPLSAARAGRFVSDEGWTPT